MPDARCSYRSCPNPAAVTVLANGGRMALCTLHESEALDRYGWSALDPLLIRPWPGTVAQAVELLRSGE